MDDRMLDLYERELAHLHSSAMEFAREFPRIAGRLSLSTGEFPCADPYVERLLEGFAYMSARVQLKLEAEFPRFTQTLLEIVSPHLTAPVPSMTVVQCAPQKQNPELAAGGFLLPRGTRLMSTALGRSRTRCEFRTAHDVRLWPFELASARYLTKEIGTLGLEPPPGTPTAPAALVLRFRMTAPIDASKIKGLDELDLFFRGPLGARLHEQVLSRTVAVCVRPVADAGPGTARWVEPVRLGAHGFTADEALLPIDARTFQGYRLLQEYFALPERFLFARVAGLSGVMPAISGSTFEVVLMLSRENPSLENRVSEESVLLYCTPAVNLFEASADRIPVTDRTSEYQVMVSRTRPLDFEVYSVRSVVGHSEGAEPDRHFVPFYRAGGFEAAEGKSRYFATHRVPRRLTLDEVRAGSPRRSYTGSEVYLSLVDSSGASRESGVAELSVEVLATNRDLPLEVAPGVEVTGSASVGAATDGAEPRRTAGQGSHFELEVNAPTASIRCVVRPTPPRASRAEGDTAWRMINQQSLNYLSLSDTDPISGAVAMRDLLRLYADHNHPAHVEQVSGVKSVRAEPVVRGVAGGGVMSFVRGLGVTLTLDDRAFVGIGPYVLGCVLEQFLARYVTVNAFTQTVLETLDRGEIARWEPRLGQRPMI
ncbi:MAG: type VI secretion system baseplate subunit TssF [Planctomycetota bacterium]|nr:type VI secretion system baseplate subunit TssF [Planctomycetota bacterium]